ncbi:glyoxalase/bleomycin resistance/extradiol dioxygenase family protein [Acidipila sp. EB88]|uniref:VOC family protein n=1 Tax=Acidipila sp. EB88 TaxID=2305226 RepID=UPI000F5EEEEC|nr:VOC family protein [Acidipila sp. EB88]RRA48732.1 VOC family protein [Acidipila sp. EB88]
MTDQNPAPAGYHSVQPYLIFADARAAIDFYTRALNATERLVMKEPGGRIAHAEIVLGDSCVMLADERPAISAYSPKHYGGSAVSLMLYAADCDALYHQAIAAGANSVREPADQPYGERMASIVDPFGYQWHIGTHIKAMSKAELEQLQS